jgi:hypothetical protein
VLANGYPTTVPGIVQATGGEGIWELNTGRGNR